MKKILAIAVATAISAPAMADLTIGGKLSMDYINKDVGSTTTEQVQRDDVTLIIKGASQTDSGLNVAGHIETEAGLDTATYANLSVGTDAVTFTAGKIANPGAAVETAAFSDRLTNEHTAGFAELDNAVMLTVKAGSATAKVATSRSVADTVTTASVSVDAGDFDLTVGYNDLDGTTAAGVAVGYSADALSATVYAVNTDNAGSTADEDSVGVKVGYAMGASSVAAFYNTDSVANAKDDNTLGLQYVYNFGGGLKAYAEHTNLSGVTDETVTTIGAAFAF